MMHFAGKTVWYWDNKIHTIGVDGHEVFDMANPEDRFKVSTILISVLIFLGFMFAVIGGIVTYFFFFSDPGLISADSRWLIFMPVEVTVLGLVMLIRGLVRHHCCPTTF